MMFSRKVFCGATRPRLPPGMPPPRRRRAAAAPQPHRSRTASAACPRRAAPLPEPNYTAQIYFSITGNYLN